MKIVELGRFANESKIVEVILNASDKKKGITAFDIERVLQPVQLDMSRAPWGVQIPVFRREQILAIKKLVRIGKKFGFLASNAEDVKKNCEFYPDELRELYKYSTRYRDLAEGTGEPWCYERHIHEADCVVDALEHAKNENGGFNSLDFASRMEYQTTEAECILDEIKSDVQTWKNRVSLAEDYLASETMKNEDNVSHETYVDTDSVKLGSKWSRVVIEDHVLNYGFSPAECRVFTKLFAEKFEAETGWYYDPDTAEASLYGSCAVKPIDFFTNEEMGAVLWHLCFETAAEQLESQLEERDESQPTPEAEEVAERIRENPGWDLNDCAELCHLAGLDIEWEEADGSEFESVVYAAAEKLGVEL